jgi:hypothetical protein
MLSFEWHTEKALKNIKEHQNFDPWVGLNGSLESLRRSMARHAVKAVFVLQNTKKIYTIRLNR